MAGQFGYAGKILRVDLSSGNFTRIPTSDYADRFIGGRGIAAKIYWDEVPPETQALAPENRLIIMTGPMAGYVGLAGSFGELSGKSPATTPERYSQCSVGGSWAGQLKLAGYDGMVIQGKAERPVYLVVDDDTVQIRDASALRGKTTVETREILKGDLGGDFKVLATGPAGENRVAFASILADEDASGSQGFGAVMGSKNLKAIAARGQGKMTAAQPERLKELIRHVSRLKKGASLADFGLITDPQKMQKQLCYSCVNGCSYRASYRSTSGKEGKFMCQSGIFYQVRANRYYKEWNEVPFLANKLCDEMGLDTRVTETLIAWLVRCYYAGILNDANTGLPLSKIGSLEFIDALLKTIASREGFGDILARGTLGAANAVGEEAKKLITDYIVDGSGQAFEGDPRIYIATGLMYMMMPRGRPHQIMELITPVWRWQDWLNKAEGTYMSSEVVRAIGQKFLGSELAMDFSTYEGKALAAKKVQDRGAVKESLILCGFHWPIVETARSKDHVGDPTLESQAFSAVTGKEVDEEGLYKLGERVFNLHRAILAREGHRGRKSDVLPEIFYTMPLTRPERDPESRVPGKSGEAVSKKGAVVDREQFESLKDEYYQLRDWDGASGLQTKKKLRELGLGDIVPELEKRGLVI